MSRSGFVKTNEKIAEKLVQGYQKIEETVVDNDQKIENAVTGSYQKIEDSFVKNDLTKEGETTEDAKKRLKEETENV